MQSEVNTNAQKLIRDLMTRQMIRRQRILIYIFIYFIIYIMCPENAMRSPLLDIYFSFMFNYKIILINYKTRYTKINLDKLIDFY